MARDLTAQQREELLRGDPGLADGYEWLEAQGVLDEYTDITAFGRRVLAEAQKAQEKASAQTTERCLICDGTGRVWECEISDPCDQCDGTGRRPVPKEGSQIRGET